MDLDPNVGSDNFRADNHYTSRFYLKPWSSLSGVWIYRLLVSHPNVPLWDQKSITSVARIRHLYTRTSSGEASDEVEQWFEREFETPAAPVIQKVISDNRLTRDDWHILIRFLAAQDLRTPKAYFEDTARWDRTLPDLLKTTLEQSVQRITEITKAGKKLPEPTSTNKADMPFRVFQDHQAGKIGVEVLNGRELWMSQMKRMLETTAKVLHEHHWTILAPPKGTTWLTSDNPVIHLSFRSPSDYKLGRAWGRRKINIILPVSPHHLMITQVGERSPHRGTKMSLEQASLIRRVTAENAFRVVFADNPDSEVPSLRNRIEDAEKFRAEQQYWATWQDKQSEAEEEFQPKLIRAST
jgi:hypothetical protein